MGTLAKNEPAETAPTTRSSAGPNWRLDPTSKIVADGITFDDVLLIPRASSISPHETNVSTRLTRNISLGIPLMSAPMDTVTESALAIALAQEGGIGIIHKNLTGRGLRPARSPRLSAPPMASSRTRSPSVRATPSVAHWELMRQHGVSGFPVTDDRLDRRSVTTQQGPGCWAS